MRILIVKTSSLGDILQALPTLSLLRELYPDATIDWAVETRFKEVLEALPAIDHVYHFDLKGWKKRPIRFRQEIYVARKALRSTPYDLLIDLQGNLKSALITQAARAKQKVGTTFRSAPEWPNAFFLTHRYPLNKKDPIAAQYLSLIEKHLSLKSTSKPLQLNFTLETEEEKWIEAELKPHRRFMICLGSHWENKKLSLPTWIELLKKIEKETPTHFYFVWGSALEKEEARALHAQFPENSILLPRMRLPLWQRMMSHMDHILTIDSSALHLAATTATPTTSFFGPSSASVYNPPGAHHTAFQGTCPYGKTFTKRCPALRTCPTGACLKEASPEALFENIPK